MSQQNDELIRLASTARDHCAKLASELSAMRVDIANVKEAVERSTPIVKFYKVPADLQSASVYLLTTSEYTYADMLNDCCMLRPFVCVDLSRPVSTVTNFEVVMWAYKNNSFIEHPQTKQIPLKGFNYEEFNMYLYVMRSDQHKACAQRLIDAAWRLLL